MNIFSFLEVTTAQENNPACRLRAGSTLDTLPSRDSKKSLLIEGRGLGEKLFLLFSKLIIKMAKDDKVQYKFWFIRVTPEQTPWNELAESFISLKITYMAYVLEAGNPHSKVFGLKRPHYHIAIQFEDTYSRNELNTLITHMGIPSGSPGRACTRWDGELACLDYMHKDADAVIYGHRLDMLTAEEHRQRYKIYQRRVAVEAKTNLCDAVQALVMETDEYDTIANKLRSGIESWTAYRQLCRLIVEHYMEYLKKQQLKPKSKHLRKHDYDIIMFQIGTCNHHVLDKFKESEIYFDTE